MSEGPHGAAGQSGTVLIVDDVPRNVQLLGSILAQEGYEVLSATSGSMALERLSARLPDLVLLDLMMPGMDGLEVCRRIKQDPKTLDLPVIFLTAANESELAAKALKEGAVDFINKPFNTSELLARVRTHVDLKQTRDELRRIIRQKNELMSAVAHDLKNPVSAVRFSAHLLRNEGLRAPDPRAELVDSIIESCDGVLGFIQARLEQSALEAKAAQVRVEVIDVGEVAEDVIRQNMMLAHAKQQKLTTVGVLKELPLAKGDPDAVGRVLDNLISNAIKFSPAGAEIRVEAGVGGGGARVLKLVVVDQGPGLTAEDSNDLFKPYQRLSARPTGGESSTGLGLSIAYELVRSMGGDIGCDSEPGKGASFWFTLPLADAQG